MKEKREMLVILAGLTMGAAWPGGAYLLLSRLGAPEWLTSLVCIVAFLLALWAYLTLQKAISE